MIWLAQSAAAATFTVTTTADTGTGSLRQAILDAGSTAATGEPAFVAIKCTALGKPELLMRMSSIIVQAQLLFKVTDRAIMSYTNAKRLAMSLSQLVKRYEQQFGEIQTQPGQRR